jgi:3-oxoacyl-[acyl-carrier-protein] synthase-3
MPAYIKAISYHLPGKVFSNEDFFKAFPDSVSQKDNYDRIGVKERRIVEADVTASDLAVEAAKALFSEHRIRPSEIDFLLFCALEFDHTFPASVSIIQEKLGLPTSCGALDYSLGCSGYVYGLGLARGLVESLGMKNVLLLTSSTLTKKIHVKDRSSRFVFGDAAAATLISSRESSGMSSFVFGTDGKMADKIIIRDGAARNPLSESSFIERENEHGNITADANLYMDGAAVFHFGLKTVPQMIGELLSKEKLNLSDIDLFIFHQANLFLIDTIRTKMKIPEEKVFNYMGKVGNTVAASIPITLHEAIKAGRARPGQKILVAGFGVGLSWAATIVEL